MTGLFVVNLSPNSLSFVYLSINNLKRLIRELLLIASNFYEIFTIRINPCKEIIYIDLSLLICGNFFNCGENGVEICVYEIVMSLLSALYYFHIL
jgi:hypothetical protein